MLVKFLKSISGTNFKYSKGAEVDIPDGLANHYASIGFCIIIGDVLEGKPIAKAPEKSKKDYHKLLDAKGIKYDKRWSIKRLKELL